jgi:hypothetical protein
VANPWGLSQQPRVRGNVNGVDLNRNFDYKWSSCVETTKGSAAFSEKETQYIRDVLLSIQTEVISCFDFHQTGTDFTDDMYVAFPETIKSDYINQARDVVEYFKQYYIVNESPSIRQIQNSLPIFTNWAYSAMNVKVPVMTVEYCDKKQGDVGMQYDSNEVTMAVNLFGNYINTYVKKYTNNFDEVFYFFYGDNGSNIISAGTTYLDVPLFKQNFNFVNQMSLIVPF